MVAELKTIPEIEAERGIDRNSLYHWTRNGLKFITKGRVILIDLDDLDDFMRRRVRKREMYVLVDEDKSDG